MQSTSIPSLTRSVFRFPLEFELPGFMFYCICKEKYLIIFWNCTEKRSTFFGNILKKVYEEVRLLELEQIIKKLWNSAWFVLQNYADQSRWLLPCTSTLRLREQHHPQRSASLILHNYHNQPRCVNFNNNLLI